MKEHEIKAVLFVDIVGSTNLYHKLGDEIACSMAHENINLVS
jgi:hypothetical protein